MARVIICGSRHWNDHQAIYKRMLELDPDDVVITGGARGADTIAHGIAYELAMETEVYPAEWQRYGTAAGPIRNRQMAETGVDLVIAFLAPNSRGTQNMIDTARKMRIPVEIVRPRMYSGSSPPDLLSEEPS